MTAGLAIATKLPVRSEKAELRLCDDMATRASFDVVDFDAPHRQLVTPGIPDRRYRHRRRRVTFWFEGKAADGQLTTAQHNFLLGELEAGELAACGTLDDFSRVMVETARAGANQAAALVACKHIVDVWARRGFRPEKARKLRRPRMVRR